jgi:hypothetical protein
MHPASIRGTLAIVMNVRRDAMDAETSLTNEADADGKAVWS